MAKRQVFLPKWTELVVALYNTPEKHRYSERLHRATRMTTRHLRSLIADLESLGILECRKPDGKIRYIHLTEKGAKLAETFLHIYPTLKR